MEAQSTLGGPPPTIDATSPFRSVKEAVAIFGERLRFPQASLKPTSVVPLQETHKTSPRNPSRDNTPISSETTNEPIITMPNIPQNIVHENDLVMVFMVLKKLESEVKETKKELNLLKKRESETQMAITSLHNNVSRIIAATAEKDQGEGEKSRPFIDGGGGGTITAVRMEERSSGDNDNTNNNMIVKSMDSPTLAKIMSITSDYEGYNFREGRKANNKNKVLMKKKPIVPLITDIFPWKKMTLFSASLFSSRFF